MGVTTTTIADPLGTVLVIDSASNATSEDNTTGNAASTVYACEIDNSQNVAASYVKIADVASLVPGTDAAEFQLHVPGGAKMTYMIAEGVAFTAGLSFFTVISPHTATAQDANAAQGPGSAVSVKILCT